MDDSMISRDQLERSTFEGWALVELFGHVQQYGYVTTLYFGNTPMFKVTDPGQGEREVTLLASTYVGHKYLYNGSVIHKAERPAKERIIGISAIYSIQPMTEAEVASMLDGLQGPDRIVSEAEREAVEQDYPF